MLDELYDFATQDRFHLYVHNWRQGDLVIWDNRCTLHRATPLETDTYKRDVRRNQRSTNTVLKPPPTADAA